MLQDDFRHLSYFRARSAANLELGFNRIVLFEPNVQRISDFF